MNYAGNQSEIETRMGLTYATHDSVALAGDLYLPKGSGPFPILIGIHGGGWVLGSKDSDEPLCRDLRARFARPLRGQDGDATFASPI